MFAVIDIETTGGNPRTERITEVAVFLFDGNSVVDSFVTLVNPEKPIPPFITRLTGISDAMVAKAPRFCDIARKLVEITENKPFVAHNAPFDYGFIREEYRRLGYDYHRERICTVRLGRRLIPGLRSYGLGSLCQHLGIQIDFRHRAAGDANAVVQLLRHYLAQNDADRYIQLTSGNNNIEKEIIGSLPETTGVYYLLNNNGDVIYIGKSCNIRHRVAQHLIQCRTRRAIDMKNAITSATYEETGSDLIAMLLESEEIKNIAPLYNRKQRRKSAQYGLYMHTDTLGYQHLKIEKTRANGIPSITYSTMVQAKTHLFGLIENYRLCQKLCGLYVTNGACFQYGVKLCNGACVGEEPAQDYNKRISMALESFTLGAENLFVFDK
ncbi:MAG TPA: exonuclease domain-containing protein, partial [Bacteroidales bacterium]|nr:exonuclease domain-containing protein [Bacteroidales bacterium]